MTKGPGIVPGPFVVLVTRPVVPEHASGASPPRVRWCLSTRPVRPYGASGAPGAVAVCRAAISLRVSLSRPGSSRKTASR